jgi:predicted nucleic-acid-binding Zn-ribbon protein
MSEDIIPKCSNTDCQSTEFKVELNNHLGDVNGDTFQFVFCKTCGTTVGTLPYSQVE